MRNYLFYITVLLSGCYLSDEVPPDQQIWDYALPIHQGINQVQLQAVNAFIIAGEYENIRSVMILKNDKLVFENHYANGERNQPRSIDRLTLIFTQMAVGLMLHDGLIDSIETPIHHYLPEYNLTYEEYPLKMDITLEHLLTHRSGIAWNESVVSTESVNNDINKMKESLDVAGYVIKKPLEAVPGFRFNYNSGSGYLISKICTEITGQSMEDYIKERVLNPLEIETYSWDQDRTGVTNGMDGLELSPFDLLKIGQLYLDEGLWKNQEIIPFDWFIESTSSQYFISNQFGYAYYWNKFNPEFQENYFGLPTNNAFYMTGNQGDALYILPEKNLSVVIYAENLFYGFYNPTFFLYADIVSTLN